MSTDFKYVISEINKYSSGIHLLNAGVDEPLIQIFEKKYNICIPALYKQWLKMFNGGEFFALPVGTSFAGILGNDIRKKGFFYLEDNFDNSKRAGASDNLFIIGELCDGELIAFDLLRTTSNDGHVVQYDVESGQVIDEWGGFEQWLDFVLQEGYELFDYEGNDK